MADFMMVMMGEASRGVWDSYIKKLIDTGKFRGGSALGRGTSVSKNTADGESTVTGFIRLVAADLDEARTLLEGNPLYEAGGTIELLEEVQE